ncbi:MAG: hypothetical protein H7329_02385, partial [Opitutaceae bacterium]|nr:hypothetical protein [Cytophagales bacterium]
MRSYYILFLILLTSFKSQSQNDSPISGYLSSSAMICSSGKIFAWGSNQIALAKTEYTGILGVGSTNAYETLPKPVTGSNKFNSLTFKQLAAGSGKHIVALACDGSVWAWGNNRNGQIGNGSNDSVITEPMQVKAGAMAGTKFDDGSGNLIGVKLVSSGNLNSYAILNDGRLLSWGSNNKGNNGTDDTFGQLGDGTTVDRRIPVFVLEGSSKLPMFNVINVCAGDAVAYALIDEDGDGLGNVYSWGKGRNGTLGRSVDGSPWSISKEDYSSYAFPVKFLDNSLLSNISIISAGDVIGLALDKDGNVWAWGNGAWAGCTGQGQHISHGDPRKVLNGETSGHGSDGKGPYLKAKSISAGQGFAMAVTRDGKPVAWGNNGGCDRGGSLGIASSLPEKRTPSYIINSITNTIDSNVVSIIRGDVFGFYITNDNKVYTWGCNKYGQLGIGDTFSVNKVVPLIFKDCELKDLKPYAKFLNSDTMVCASKMASSPVLLKSNFSISVGQAPKYQTFWYKDTTLVKGPLSATNPQSSYFMATSPGAYSVKIKYIGGNDQCNSYADAIDKISIQAFPKTFSVEDEILYNGDTLKPKVTTTSTYSPLYAWYGSPTSNVVLAYSTGTSSVSIPKNHSALSPLSNGDIKLYLEEKSPVIGSIKRKDTICTPLYYQTLRSDTSDNYVTRTHFVAYEKLKITSFKLLAKAALPVPGKLSGKLHFAAYGYQLTPNGVVIPNDKNILNSFEMDFEISRSPGDSVNKFFELTVPFNIEIPGTADGFQFFISRANVALTNKIGSGTIAIANTGCNQAFPLADNGNGKILKSNYTAEYINTSSYPGPIFDLKFEKSQGFCDRIPVLMKNEFPTSLEDHSPIAELFTIYPNPANKVFVLNAKEAGTLRLMNLQGMEVSKRNVM